MKKIAVMLANGFEEIEALTPVDVIRRTGGQCVTFSVCDEWVTGRSGIVVKADAPINDFNPAEFDAIILPGGMPGAKILGENSAVLNAVREMDAQGKIIAAICAAPAVVLGLNGLISGRKVTCYPAEDFINMLGEVEASEGNQGNYTGRSVERDGNLITADGLKSAMQFALTICDALKLTPRF